MHSQRSRIESAGRRAIAGDGCHYAGARVHGGKHDLFRLAGVQVHIAQVPDTPACKAKKADHKEGEQVHVSLLSKTTERRIEPVRSPLKRVAGEFSNQGQQANEEAQEMADVAHLGLHFLALGLVIWPIKLNARLNKVSADLAQNP